VNDWGQVLIKDLPWALSRTTNKTASVRCFFDVGTTNFWLLCRQCDQLAKDWVGIVVFHFITGVPRGMVWTPEERAPSSGSLICGLFPIAKRKRPQCGDQLAPARTSYSRDLSSERSNHVEFVIESWHAACQQISTGPLRAAGCGNMVREVHAGRCRAVRLMRSGCLIWSR